MALISFCLQRFENIYGGKIDRHVHFEERLCLAGYMCRAGKVCFSCSGSCVQYGRYCQLELLLGSAICVMAFDSFLQDGHTRSFD